MVQLVLVERSWGVRASWPKDGRFGSGCNEWMVVEINRSLDYPCQES